MNSSLRKNIIYSVLYQILILIIPLITIPYVSRVIGVSGIGEYSYTYSIVYYFVLMAMLGFNNYGNRSIAKVRDDKEKLSKTFKEIYLLQFFSSILMIIAYIVYLLFFCKNYNLVSYIEIIYIFSCLFDINWLFFGLEKFKLTITRNTIIKIITLIMIFVFVKDPMDTWVYTLILASGTIISNIMLWPFVKKYVDLKKYINIRDIKKHIIPTLKLFLPVIAVTIYKVMDKTMLGIMTNIDEVGYYENAEKIINIPIAVIGALGNVMLPRMSNLYANNKSEEGCEMIKKSIKIMMFLSFAMTFGLIAISKNFSIIFFGNEFEKTGYLIIYLAITILFLSWGNVIRTQYLIPKEMDKEYIISAFLGAIVNLVFNIILIPKYSSIGACISTILAEFVVAFYQTIKVSKYLPIKEYLKSTFSFLFTSILMFIIISLLPFMIKNGIYLVILQILLGAILYFLLNYKYVFIELSLKNKIKQLITKRYKSI